MASAAKAVELEIFAQAVQNDNLNLADYHLPYTQVKETWPWLKKSCPVPCQCQKTRPAMEFRDALEVILHVVDHHQWSKQRLVKWIASLEESAL